ncbi:neuroligin-3-like [Penaeus chinensis]|uniref:neuroligin-3-like n=1 Tax=Penaeus chinensis TaxID=139456 RepID=UPI001FB7D529|nr:neuroligin-3-like [Penaeus chinensis]
MYSLYVHIFYFRAHQKETYSSAEKVAYPVVVYVHGESYEWGSASLYDGSVLAALGRLIVVTINYRLGILGFFNPNVDPLGRATVANYGLMDQLAALHWVQENIVRFGGDPGHVTVMGHGTGAACLNFLVISPAAAAGLFKRAILMSGSALSPWAAVQEPVYYAVQAARQLGCDVPDDLYRHYETLLHCLRDRTVDQILQVELETPQFLSSIGPSVDGVTIRPDWKQQHTKMGQEGRTPVDILLGVTATDILEVFSDAEIQHGFEADHRDRILRTFVTNNYRYHLQEIVLAITAEYTDWSRPVQHPVNIRDLTAEALHDAALVSPVTVAANQLYTAARAAFFYVIDHTLDDPDPERGPEVSLNELLYVFGTPLGAGGPVAPPINYTKTEAALSESVITTWTNFIKTGNPNEAGVGGDGGNPREKYKYKSQDWANYDPQYRRYLEFGSRGRVRDHYRASRVALWSWLVPGLERVGARYGPDSPFHRLPDHQRPDTFSGPTRPTNLSSNLLPPPTTPPPPPTTPAPASSPAPRHTTPPGAAGANGSSSVAGLLEGLGLGQRQPQPHPQQGAAAFPYTTALSLTVAIGCSLLILNLLVFAAVYYRRDSARGHVALNKPASGSRGRRGLGGRRHRPGRHGRHGRRRHRRAAALARRRLQALVAVALRNAALVRHAALLAGHVVRRRPARVAARLHHVLPGRPDLGPGRRPGRALLAPPAQRHGHAKGRSAPPAPAEVVLVPVPRRGPAAALALRPPPRQQRPVLRDAGVRPPPAPTPPPAPAARSKGESLADALRRLSIPDRRSEGSRHSAAAPKSPDVATEHVDNTLSKKKVK